MAESIAYISPFPTLPNGQLVISLDIETLSEYLQQTSEDSFEKSTISKLSSGIALFSSSGSLSRAIFLIVVVVAEVPPQALIESISEPFNFIFIVFSHHFIR